MVPLNDRIPMQAFTQQEKTVFFTGKSEFKSRLSDGCDDDWGTYEHVHIIE
jgi:hypothetical protein